MTSIFTAKYTFLLRRQVKFTSKCGVLSFCWRPKMDSFVFSSLKLCCCHLDIIPLLGIVHNKYGGIAFVLTLTWKESEIKSIIHLINISWNILEFRVMMVNVVLVSDCTNTYMLTKKCVPFILDVLPTTSYAGNSVCTTYLMLFYIIKKIYPSFFII